MRLARVGAGAGQNVIGKVFMTYWPPQRIVFPLRARDLRVQIARSQTVKDDRRDDRTRRGSAEQGSHEAWYHPAPASVGPPLR